MIKINIQFLGHSCFLIESEGNKVIIDPFLNNNPIATAKAEDIVVDAIMITHGHADHIGDAISIAKRNNCHIIAEDKLALHLSQQGVEAHRLGIGGVFDFPWGKVKLVHAQHGTAIEGEQENVYGTPTGFVVTMNNKTFYHAGDTGLFGDMKVLGEFNNIDVALLPIGDNFTMGINDSVIAAEWLKASKNIPMHYNTFDIIKQDSNEWLEKMAANNLNGQVLKVGEILSI